MLTTAVRKAEKALTIYRDLGGWTLAAELTRSLGRAIGVTGATEARRQARRAQVDTAFDGAESVDTGGVQHLYGLAIVGPNARYGISHIACDPDEFDAALARLEQDFAGQSFVDLGSGKGRAVILAARYPFRSIVGVEFAAELHAAAEANLAMRPAADRQRIRLVNEDATRFVFPDGPLVVFLYHPFGGTVCRQVAERLMDEVRARPRPVRVVYLNPQHQDAWTSAGWHTESVGAGFVILAP